MLLAALSWEIIAGDHVHISGTYLTIQFIVCLVFLCDFFVRWTAAERRTRFFWRNLPFLLLSVPYLNILARGAACASTHDWAILAGLIPLLRAFLATIIIARRFVLRHQDAAAVRRLYLYRGGFNLHPSALVFYDYEALANTKLHGFGNALWWAWMNVTTVGAAIFPVTVIGKIFCLLLPSLGIMRFLIFTTYVLQEKNWTKKPVSRPDPFRAIAAVWRRRNSCSRRGGAPRSLSGYHPSPRCQPGLSAVRGAPAPRACSPQCRRGRSSSGSSA
ncbi:MAG: potassium channel family protein [Alistipes senegalensis]